MTKQPLKKLFEAMFPGKPSFEDFLKSPMQENYEKIGPNKPHQLFKPKNNLKIFHKFLNFFLFEFLPINEKSVFSYRKGFSAFHAVEKHKQGRYFFQTDIVSFFESIDRKLAKNVILSGIDKTPINDIEQHIDRIIDLIFIDNFLPIGFPTSAPLSNAILYRFDNETEELCKRLNLTYSRYADDIIISGQNQNDLSDIEDKIQYNLQEFGSNKFFINKRKTRFFQIGGKIKILGIMILPNGKITADTKIKQETEVLIHFYIKNKTKFEQLIASKKKQNHNQNTGDSDSLDFISGKLNHIASIDPDYINKIRRKFGAGTIDTLLHRGTSRKK